MDISLYRANANKVAARILLDLITKYGAKLVDFHGGNMRNAIPFEAKLTVLVPADKKAAAAEEAKAVFALEKAEHSYSDPKMLILVDDVETPASYIDDKTALRAVKAIMVCPNGVIRMSDSMPGLTETSTNLAIVSTTGGHLTIHSLMRSSIDSAKANLAQSMQCLFELAGASFKTEGGYCGWVPKPETPVYQVIKDTYKSLFGKEIKVTATHGGLECALLGAKYPEWEMVSIGPTIVHPHSPDERVNIESVGKAYEFVAKFLENVPLKK
jgi:dipeptidase D